MLTSGRATVKHLSLQSADWSVLPCSKNRPILTIATDVMPEERSAYRGVFAFFFDETASVVVQFCVCAYCFVLSNRKCCSLDEE